MANDLNCCHFTGRLIADCEQSFTQSGTSCLKFKIAVNKTWKDKSGEKKESAQFVPITAWGKLGESLSSYLLKGKQVRVTGEWETSVYGEENNRKYFTGINAKEIQLLGGKTEQANKATAQNANLDDVVMTAKDFYEKAEDESIPF